MVTLLAASLSFFYPQTHFHNVYNFIGCISKLYIWFYTCIYTHIVAFKQCPDGFCCISTTSLPLIVLGIPTHLLSLDGSLFKMQSENIIWKLSLNYRIYGANKYNVRTPKAARCDEVVKGNWESSFMASNDLRCCLMLHSEGFSQRTSAALKVWRQPSLAGVTTNHRI